MLHVPQIPFLWCCQGYFSSQENKTGSWQVQTNPRYICSTPICSSQVGVSQEVSLGQRTSVFFLPDKIPTAQAWPRSLAMACPLLTLMHSGDYSLDVLKRIWGSGRSPFPFEGSVPKCLQQHDCDPTIIPKSHYHSFNVKSRILRTAVVVC